MWFTSIDSVETTTYEERCQALATQFAADLDGCATADRTEALSCLTARLQADLNLADYKFKFRQADKVKWLAYGPIVVSVATLVLALVLAGFSAFELQQKTRDARAALFLTVLAQPPQNREHFLKFFRSAELIKLEPGDLEQLKTLPVLQK